MSFVQHLAVLNTLENRSEMSDMGRSRAGLQADAREEVICPKPRRLPLISCCAPELMKPKCQWQRWITDLSSVYRNSERKNAWSKRFDLHDLDYDDEIYCHGDFFYPSNALVAVHFSALVLEYKSKS